MCGAVKQMQEYRIAVYTQAFFFALQGESLPILGTPRPVERAVA